MTKIKCAKCGKNKDPILIQYCYGVTEKKGIPIVSSRNVAAIFNKEHYNVLRDIEELDCSKGFNDLNFELVRYKDRKGERRPEYLMTKDGFIFLVMGYRSKKAAVFKEAYINRFNEMEQLIKNLYEAKVEFPEFTDAIDEVNILAKRKQELKVICENPEAIPFIRKN